MEHKAKHLSVKACRRVCGTGLSNTHLLTKEKKRIPRQRRAVVEVGRDTAARGEVSPHNCQRSTPSVGKANRAHRVDPGRSCNNITSGMVRIQVHESGYAQKWRHCGIGMMWFMLSSSTPLLLGVSDLLALPLPHSLPRTPPGTPGPISPPSLPSSACNDGNRGGGRGSTASGPARDHAREKPLTTTE